MTLALVNNSHTRDNHDYRVIISIHFSSDGLINRVLLIKFFSLIFFLIVLTRFLVFPLGHVIVPLRGSRNTREIFVSCRDVTLLRMKNLPADNTRTLRMRGNRARDLIIPAHNCVYSRTTNATLLCRSDRERSVAITSDANYRR